MKNLLELKRFQIKGSRVNQIYPLTEHSGAFRVYIGGRSFDVIASVDEGGGVAWEHVSVCRPHSDKLPTWEEMCAIKDMFFEPEEECVQFHPKKSSYANIAQNCLHIWRPVDGVLYMKSPYKEGICNGNEN